MSALAPTAGAETSSTPRPSLTTADPQLAKYRERIQNGRNDRRRYEPVWQLCQSFLQNRQWVGWNYMDRRIVELPNPDDRERVTVNVLTQYLWTFLGKLTTDDFRPDLSFRRDDGISRAFARQSRRAFEWGWDEEWEGDTALLEAFLYMGSFGTAAIRVRVDPSYGESIGEYPVDEQGTVHVTDSHEFMDKAFSNGGSQVDYRELNEGRICWDPLSPFNILPPPGVAHERDFPYLDIERPVSIEKLKLIYGAKADKLVEEPMRAIDMIGVREDSSAPGSGGAASGMLKGHVRLYTSYDMPTRENPKGEMIVHAGNTVLEGPKPLPVQMKGQGKIGIGFFKYHPVPGRFWSIGAVEPGLGPQKQRNRARSQWIEMKDRAGLGRVFAYKGTVTSVNKPKGGIFELVEVLPGHDFPKETQGVAPGEWLQAEVQQNDSDLDRVMGLREVSLGQAPAGVSAYSAFALLAEQDDRRVGPILKSSRIEIAKLSKVTLATMRAYWLPGKKISVGAGDDGDELLDFFLYDASRLPDDVYIRFGKGAPLPQSQAAQAQKIFDLFDRSISSGQALPLDWLYDSLESGRPLPIPKREPQMQLDSADLENNLMVHGTPVQVRPYDNDELHVQRHRIAQQAFSMIPSMGEVAQVIEMHVQQHLASAQAKASQASPGAPGIMGGATGGGGGGTNPGGFGAMGAAREALTSGAGMAAGPGAEQ